MDTDTDTDFDTKLEAALARFLGEVPAAPPTPGEPLRPPPAARRPGVLMAFRSGELEVGLLFYGGGSRSKIWLHPGYGKGRISDMNDPAQMTSFPYHIVMSCGAEATFESQSQIPPASRDCACASANHRLVHYSDPPDVITAQEKEPPP